MTFSCLVQPLQHQNIHSNGGGGGGGTHTLVYIHAKPMHTHVHSQLMQRAFFTVLAAAGNQGKDTAQVLLSLYEFEAKAKLGMKGLSSVLDYLRELPQSDASTFETIAGKEDNISLANTQI